MGRNRVWIIFVGLFLSAVFLAGCGLVFYNPLTSGGEEYDINVIKNVIQWLKYYTETENIAGIESLLYPFTPNYETLKEGYESLFASCNNIKWDYSISEVVLQEDNKALVTGDEVLTSDCGEARGELYIVMKRAEDGTWYIYDKRSLYFDND